MWRGIPVVEDMLQVQSTYQMHGWMDVSYIHLLSHTYRHRSPYGVYIYLQTVFRLPHEVSISTLGPYLEDMLRHYVSKSGTKTGEVFERF
jgi:hypothetical protein